MASPTCSCLIMGLVRAGYPLRAFKLDPTQPAFLTLVRVVVSLGSAVGRSNAPAPFVAMAFRRLSPFGRVGFCRCLPLSLLAEIEDEKDDFDFPEIPSKPRHESGWPRILVRDRLAPEIGESCWARVFSRRLQGAHEFLLVLEIGVSQVEEYPRMSVP